MRTDDLIRRHAGGAEMPAPGWWPIVNSHVTVSFDARTAWLRRVHGTAPWACGGLDVADDPATVALVLHIGAAPRGDVGTAHSLAGLLAAERLDPATLEVHAFAPTNDAPWRADASIRIAELDLATKADIDYHGVYRVGSEAKAWLTVAATLTHGAAGERLRHPVRVVADALAVKAPRASSSRPASLDVAA
jgi:hypothetical protein